MKVSIGLKKKYRISTVLFYRIIVLYSCEGSGAAPAPPLAVCLRSIITLTTGVLSCCCNDLILFMEQTYKIAVAGMGGVGGYYGAHLAKTYEGSPEVSVSFVARGGHLQAIRDNGLLLEKDSGNIVAHADQVTDDPRELGKLDLILLCCKGYDLERFALSFADNITDDTVLLPLLNGVGSTAILQRLFPKAKTLYGCTYLVSRIVSDGVVRMSGDMNQLFFGHPDMDRKELERIEAILGATGVNANIHDDIRLKIWEKFSFISPLATATAGLDSTVDGILENAEHHKALENLMQEIVLLAGHENVALPGDIIDNNMIRLGKMPAGATSSMHNDLRNNKNTELEMLTGYVVSKAMEHGLALPAYNKLYTLLKGRVPPGG